MTAKRKSPSSPRSTRAALPKGRFLVLVDETPIRDGMLRQHQALEEQATALRARIERFESADVPAYTRWEARAVGPLLTAIREAEAEIRRKRSILEAIEDEQFFTNCSELAAYRKVMRALERGPEPEDEDVPPGDSEGPFAPDEDTASGAAGFVDGLLPKGFDAEQFDLLSPERKREFRAQYAFMAELYESATGQPAPDLDELLRASRKEHRRQHTSPPPPPAGAATHPEPPAEVPGQKRVAARIKELYRRLVRQLHPDLNPGQSAREAELWHRVQEAYGRRDLEALEAAAARVEIVSGDAARLPIYLLRRVLQELRQALSALKGRLSEARKHPAWDFTARSRELPKIEARHRQKLEQHHRSAQTYLATLTAQLDALAERAAKPPRVRKKGPKARSPRYAQEDFLPFP